MTPQLFQMGACVQCLHNTDGDYKQCGDHFEDYLECLHHKKEVCSPHRWPPTGAIDTCQLQLGPILEGDAACGLLLVLLQYQLKVRADQSEERNHCACP
jgi:hypothetical protein